jgi:uncharacterized protein (DUF2252 family)
MFVDWNDFDATGYGAFEADLRRLGASFAIAAALAAPADAELGPAQVREAATRYADMIAELARGTRIGTVGFGVHPMFDRALTKARTRGDVGFAVDELAPVRDGRRELAVGDLEPVAEDGVLEDRVLEVDAEQAAWIDGAIRAWRPDAEVLLRARRIGAGVASYAAYRFIAVLAGPEDDLIIELKEVREGVILGGVPRLAASEWASPAARAVDTQKRLQARPDGDAMLGHAWVGAMSVKLRDREAYQRGIDVEDVVALAVKDPASTRALAGEYGAMLARAHGQALTADGVSGHTVIAPLLAGREPAFADEVVALAGADGAQILDDHARVSDLDLGAFVVGGAR